MQRSLYRIPAGWNRCFTLKVASHTSPKSHPRGAAHVLLGFTYSRGVLKFSIPHIRAISQAFHEAVDIVEGLRWPQSAAGEGM